VREAGELYRCRWKIEILFRAWKQGMNIKPALNRRNNALHHQALILAAMIYQVLTMVIMILWKPLMRKQEEVSVEKSFSVMSNHVLGLKDLRELTKIDNL
jgi:IS4 transposase